MICAWWKLPQNYRAGSGYGCHGELPEPGPRFFVRRLQSPATESGSPSGFELGHCFGKLAAGVEVEVATQNPGADIDFRDRAASRLERDENDENKGRQLRQTAVVRSIRQGGGVDKIYKRNRGSGLTVTLICRTERVIALLQRHGSGP